MALAGIPGYMYQYMYMYIHVLRIHISQRFLRIQICLYMKNEG